MDSDDGWVVSTKGPKSQKADKNTRNTATYNISKKVTMKHSLKEKNVMYTS